jgi:Lon protease-like protein
MQIPLFPLHTVLAPGIALPLHVFEERYRALVRHCLDTASPFGVVLIREGSEVLPRDGSPQELAIAGVGTLAEIREASRYDDGRWDVLAVGSRRFVVLEVNEDAEPYLVAEVDSIDDAVGNEAVADALVQRVTARFVQYLRMLQPRDGEAAEPIDVQVEVEVPEIEDDEPGVEPSVPGGGPSELASALRIPDDPSALSFLLTGIIQVEPDRKQALLEAVSAEERLRDLDQLLDRELALLSRRLAPFTPDRTTLASRAN